MTATFSVVAVSAGEVHGPHKPIRDVIELVAGLGVVGDAHSGRTVQHRSRARAHPEWENLRQVHLIDAALHVELRRRGFAIGPGEMGENILTVGIDLLGCATGTTFRFGQDAVVELTGLRNPCAQLNSIQAGLMEAVLSRQPNGAIVRRAGVMSVVKASGLVRAGDAITVHEPFPRGEPLRPV